MLKGWEAQVQLYVCLAPGAVSTMTTLTETVTKHRKD